MFSVGPGEYAKLNEFLDHFGSKTRRVLTRTSSSVTLHLIATRLTYNHKERSLLVEMPSAIHEAPMAAIQCDFLDFFSALPFPESQINVNVLTGITSKSSVPDLRISLQNIADRRFSVIVVGLGETAFSQGMLPMYNKLKTAVQVNPSLLLVLAAVVDETRRYHAPRAGSPAWNTLLFEPTIRSQGDFIAGASLDPPALDRPVVIEGHTWSSVAMVRIKAWIRVGDVDADDHTIDINTTDPNEVAEGVSFSPLSFKLYLICSTKTFFPTNSMDEVLSIIERGANMMRERLILLCQDIHPNMDVSPLRDPSIAFRFNLDRLRTKLVGAMGEIAYERYEDWYNRTPRPRGTKRGADTLEPVSSGTRSKKKRQRIVGGMKRR